MATWLYLASNSRASAENTYRYAEKGFVWRPYYSRSENLRANNKVANLKYGDTLYIGYRENGNVRLLGRCIIEHPDTCVGPSQVFCAAPQEIEEDMRSDGYTDDPVLSKLVGICVSAIEPLEGCIEVPNGGERNSIVELEFRIQQEIANPTAMAASPLDSGFAVPAGDVVPQGSSRDDEPNSTLYVGVDVAGRPSKGFTLCFLEFTAETLKDISFGGIPYDSISQMPPTTALRDTVRRGDLEQLARMTWNAAESLSATFDEMVVSRRPQGVFIDSPTAFSRNTLGHGRATEKVSYRGVSFQCTPSTACNRTHGGDWNWLVYGMVAYASLRGTQLTEDVWRHALVNGMYADFVSFATDIHVRECFPTATVSVLRTQDGAAPLVSSILAPFTDNARCGSEVRAVHGYLERGVSAVKTRAALYDRADALVAGLLALPQVMPKTFRETEREPLPGRKWRGADVDLEREGRIAVVEKLS